MEVNETAIAYRAQRNKLTHKDYLQFPEDRFRYEVIDGELYMSPSPKVLHQRTLLQLSVILQNFLNIKPIGEIIIAPIDVVLNDSDIVVPDIIFIASANKKILTENNVQGAPDMIIEILSRYNPSNDLVRKKALYELYGVKEYWIVDPQEKAVVIYSLVNGKYAEARQLERKDKLRSAMLHGLEIDLEDIFRE
jgi:Uma2 family endonuclease